MVDDAEAATNLVKSFLAEGPDFRRTFIKARIWSYQMDSSASRQRVLSAYGEALTVVGYAREEQAALQAAFRADIEAQRELEAGRERLEELARRVENVEALLGQIFERLDGGG